MKKLSTQNILIGAVVIAGGWYFWNKSKQNKELSKEVDVTPDETDKDTSKQTSTDLTSVDTGEGYRTAVSPAYQPGITQQTTQQPLALAVTSALLSTGIKKPKIKIPFGKKRKKPIKRKPTKKGKLLKTGLKLKFLILFPEIK